MDIRQNKNEQLNNIDSETLLKRLYEIIKYIYIYQMPTRRECKPDWFPF